MPIEIKIARICWNTDRWIKPSGPLGKSKNHDSYEFNYGFGHEEWLLDTTKLINGYHYGYLQAIGQHREKYIGHIYNISIYSINNKTKQRWWIGQINKVLTIDEAESFAVIKFKPEDLDLLDFPLEFSYDDPAVTSDYYNLKNQKLIPKLFGLEHFRFISGHNEGNKKTISTYAGHKNDIDLIHNQIQTHLYNKLINDFGCKNVGTEVPAGKGTRIDIVVRHSNEFSFYEIKTSGLLRQCVREALGQLLEYAYFDDEVKIKEFIIVSPNKMTLECLSYLSKLNRKYGIPIVHQEFDLNSMKLHDTM